MMASVRDLLTWFGWCVPKASKGLAVLVYFLSNLGPFYVV